MRVPQAAEPFQSSNEEASAEPARSTRSRPWRAHSTGRARRHGGGDWPIQTCIPAGLSWTRGVAGLDPLAVIPGPSKARSPESITTIPKTILRRQSAATFVVMNSGLGPAGRPDELGRWHCSANPLLMTVPTNSAQRASVADTLAPGALLQRRAPRFFVRAALSGSTLLIWMRESSVDTGADGPVALVGVARR